MRKFTRTLFALVGAIVMVLSIASCASSFEKYSETPLTLTFIETSDVHGSIFPYDFIKAKDLDTSMANVASLVAEKRASGNEVILMDDGDVLQGQPAVYYYNFIKTEAPHIWSEVLNFLNYDVATIGNHDIESGHAVYDKLTKEVKAPMICANIIKEGGTADDTYFPAYTVINRQGVKIAVLGMIESKITEQLPKAFWSGMEVKDIVETAKYWIPKIQQTEKPDVIVGLFHAGVDYTYGGQTKDTPMNESASQLVAEQVPGFDIIFVGHDHQGWAGTGYNPETKQSDLEVIDPNGKRVYIYGPNANAKNAAVVNLEMKWNKEAKAWEKSISGDLVELKNYPKDEAFMAKFEPAKAELIEWVDRPIGELASGIDSVDSMYGDSAFVDLIHRIQLEICNDPSMGLKPAEISIVAPLDQYAKLSAGTVRVRDMFSLYKYENFLYTMDMTGEQIQKFLEYTYGGQFDTMKTKKDQLINFKKDNAGKLIFNARYNNYDTVTRPYNYDSFSGFKYTVDVTKPAGSRVKIISMNDGSAFDMAKTYSVAINSYRAAGGGAHLTKGVGLPADALQKLEYVTSSTTRDLRFYMLTWFEKQNGAITVETDNNWKVIPEDFAKAGRENSNPFMYPEAK